MSSSTLINEWFWLSIETLPSSILDVGRIFFFKNSKSQGQSSSRRTFQNPCVSNNRTGPVETGAPPKLAFVQSVPHTPNSNPRTALMLRPKHPSRLSFPTTLDFFPFFSQGPRHKPLLINILFPKTLSTNQIKELQQHLFSLTHSLIVPRYSH